jgi:hypothetical protein
VSDKPTPPAPPSGANPTAPTDPVKVASTEVSGAAAESEEERTAPVRLAAVWEKNAKKRRRSTAAELIVRRPKKTEVRVPIERTETVIGRDEACDIVLPEEAASRRHATIARNEGGYFEITDLGSENGVLVDGERVERMTLLDGDAFQVGDTQFRIVVGPVLGSE